MSAEACSAECCMDDACEVWQFHAKQGCFRGRPFTCFAASDGFSASAVGQRLRTLHRAAWPALNGFRPVGVSLEVDQRTFSQFSPVEPYADGPEVHRIVADDGTTLVIRRHGPGRIDVAASCWSPDRLPQHCCHGVSSNVCWGSQDQHERCCSSGLPLPGATDGAMVWYDAFIKISDGMSAETRRAWDEVVPTVLLDEAAFSRKRELFRLGALEPAEICASSGRSSADLVPLVRLLRAGPGPFQRTFVNIGAGSCAAPDPLHELLHSPEGQGFAGLAVDMNATLLAMCAESLRHSNATLASALLALAPPTAAAELRPFLAALPGPAAVGVRPRPLGVLVVDIDGCDCLVTEELLRVVRPSVLILEIAFHIPPPFRFSRQHDAARSSAALLDDYERESYDPASGCSLSYALHMLRPYGLHLFQLTDQDAVFVHESAREAVARGFGVQLPQDEFQCFRKSRVWMQMPAVYVREWFFGAHPAESLGRIWSNLSQANTRRGRPGAPFTLDY